MTNLFGLTFVTAEPDGGGHAIIELRSRTSIPILVYLCPICEELEIDTHTVVRSPTHEIFSRRMETLPNIAFNIANVARMLAGHRLREIFR